MKTRCLVITFLSTALSAHATQYVDCKGEIPGIQSVSFRAQQERDGAFQSAVIFKNLQDPQETPWELPNIDPKETSEFHLGIARFNYFFGHHNTTITISADGDIFGYAHPTENAAEHSGYRGKLVLWRGPGDNPRRNIFDVVCSTRED